MADHQTQPPTTADGPAASTLAANLQVFEPLPEDGGDLEAVSFVPKLSRSIRLTILLGF